MRTSKQMAFGVVAVLSVVAAAALLFILPNYREARAVRTQVAELQARAGKLASQTQAVDRLAEEVRAARQQASTYLKTIPETADVAGVIRKLSDEIDRVDVMDQTFTAGTPGEAIIGGESTAMAMPVTADMHATFDSILKLINKAEHMPRLVRVSSVRLVCKREEQKTEVPLLHASVGLEAIYDTLEKDDSKGSK